MKTRMRRVHRWSTRRLASVAAGDDRGTSLAELIVGMAIMTVFMALFLGAVLMMTSTANKVEATSISAGQTNQAFLRLDKIVRYASAISRPGTSPTSGDWYVELDTPPIGVSATPIDTCTQLRIDAQQLQLRTWTVNAGTAAPASGWTPIASYISNGTVAAGSPDVPFAAPAVAAGASSTFQRLQITLVALAGKSVTATNRSRVTFTALNSAASATGNDTTCQQWGRP